MKRLFTALLVLTLLICGTALAAIPEPTDDFYVYDGAGVLSDETKGMIVFSNDLLSADCGAQFVVVTVDSTDGVDISDYAYELINDWKIGDKTKQNGFLMLLAIKDENYYFEPGTGLSESMSWGKIRDTVDEYLEPDFAKGDYDAGVNKVYRQLFKKLASAEASSVTVEAGIEKYNEYISEPGNEPEEEGSSSGVGTGTGYTGSNSPQPARKSGAGGIMGYAVLIVIIIVIILLISSRGRRSRGYRGVFWMLPPRVPPVYRPTVPPPMGRTMPRPPMGGTGSQPSRPIGGIGGGVGTSRPSGRPSGGGIFGSGRSSSTSSRSFGSGSRPSSSSSRSFGGGRSSGSSGSRSFGGSHSFGGGRSSGGFGGGRSGGGGGSRGGGGGRGR